MIKHFALTLSILTSFSAQAAMTVASVTGASRVVLTGSPITITAGFAGGDCSTAAPSTSETCNSCQTPFNAQCSTNVGAPPLCACNTTRAYGDLVLTINVTGATNPVGNLAMVRGTNPIPAEVSSTSSVSVRWREICSRWSDTLTGTCETVATGAGVTNATFKVFNDANGNGTVDSNETNSVDVSLRVISPGLETNAINNVYGVGSTNGIASFEPYPGDEKVYLDNLVPGGSLSSLGYSNTKAVAVRVFFADSANGGLQSAYANITAPFAPVDLPTSPTDANTISDTKVEGLTNDTAYAFRLAIVDEGNNIVNYFPNNTDTDVTSAACTTAIDPNTCPYAASPSQVLGLLTNDFNCFIATAAYGSALEPKLDIFREFRNRTLLPSTYGRRFVVWYYQVGPKAAEFISDKPWLRSLVRVGLWPLYALSYASLKIGFAATVALTFGFVLAAMGLLLRRRSRG